MPIENVFIIGNGFDLSLGLPTSYYDFIKSEQFKKHIKDSELFGYIYGKSHFERWIDIELELAAFSKIAGDSQQFLQEYKNLCDSLSEYISSIDINLINRSSPAYKFLENSYQPSGSYIANFNYTSTVQFILEELGNDENEINDSICHIHGECRHKNIIFGINDGARINPNHIFLYKSTHNHAGGKSLRQALKSARRIFFFGHSLGESDHMYIADFFLNLGMYEENIELHFFHYGENGFFDLHKQLHKLTASRVSELKSKNIFKTYDTSIENRWKIKGSGSKIISGS